MKIALVGASGQAGSRILSELSARGHAVTAIARDPARIAALPNVTAASADIEAPEALARVLEGHDAVISSVHFSASDPDKLLGAVKASGVRRYYVVGGAGSLEVAPGVLLVNTPEFPAIYKSEAQGGVNYLNKLKAENDLDWTLLSPSAAFVPGERTGTFRLGKDQLLTNENGSSISFEDFAVALVDEIEAPAHVRQRFTVGY
ncbi:NAD(P)-dependent oxidoreductase [Rhizobium sp. Pop5]|uniref:NAD(P)-dependent oxidoreductase n=1 Tax=Rhizobium sp. Pop5 TaxID=1223565 RepID=UPI0002835FAF|nr:NAD(P)-dependent oxidoreductase [Rhizobium sp. Pop5]EJZ22227.1 NAD-dependent epimerase/dehydratase [Rhizobium sp. Pop5]UVD57068.1 NAD(P)-dependent oxidoreductase [Rhizobium sp. Pop5]